jgi:hypothetical protein
MRRMYDAEENDPRNERFVPISKRHPDAQARWWAVDRHRAVGRQATAVSHRGHDTERFNPRLEPRFERSPS